MPWIFVGIWSTGFVVARLGMPHGPPLTFLSWRYAISVAAFWPGSPWARAAWPRDGQQVLHLALTGILMHGGYLGGVWSAVKLGMGAGTAALIVGLQPVLTALWVSWSGSEQRVTRAAVAGTGAGPGRSAAGGVAQAGGGRGQRDATWRWRSARWAASRPARCIRSGSFGPATCAPPTRCSWPRPWPSRCRWRCGWNASRCDWHPELVVRHGVVGAAC